MASSLRTSRSFSSVRQAIAWTVQVAERLLFPVSCVGCGAEGEWCCVLCLTRCPLLVLQRCLYCGIVSQGGATCPSCFTSRRAIAGSMVAGEYREWLWRPLIAAWKYRSATSLTPLFVRLLLDRVPPPVGQGVVVPVPLTPRRRRLRGFNQAESLAEAVAKAWGWRYAPHCLQRQIFRSPQAGLPAEERRRNVKGAFAVTRQVDCEGSKCLLIDDVVTTGATLREAAGVLRRAGATSVSALALVRSDPSIAT